MYQVFKCIVLVLCASGVLSKLDESLLTEELKDLIATLHKTCRDQIGIEEAAIDKLREGVFEDDEKNKCYVKCVMSESGVMDENGDIDMGAYVEIIPEKIREKSKGIFEGCTKHGDGINDHCEKAFKIIQCNHAEDPENYFFV